MKASRKHRTDEGEGLDELRNSVTMLLTHASSIVP